MVIEKSKIEIKDLGFECILGTLPFERVRPQPIVLNISLELDFSKAAISESIECTVNYAALAEEIRQFVCNSKFQLLETLVLKTSKFLLEHYPRIQSVSLHVEKPEAIPGARAAAAEIQVRR
jgi:dihydroneopterin aldolase